MIILNTLRFQYKKGSRNRLSLDYIVQKREEMWDHS